MGCAITWNNDTWCNVWWICSTSKIIPRNIRLCLWYSHECLCNAANNLDPSFVWGKPTGDEIAFQQRRFGYKNANHATKVLIDVTAVSLTDFLGDRSSLELAFPLLFLSSHRHISPFPPTLSVKHTRRDTCISIIIESLNKSISFFKFFVRSKSSKQRVTLFIHNRMYRLVHRSMGQKWNLYFY